MAKDDCQEAAGVFAPRINRNRCEAKGDCVDACPYQVFEIQTVSEADKQGLNLLGRLKLWVHGGRQAYAVNADACHACGLCVSACPERAITLQRAD